VVYRGVEGGCHFNCERKEAWEEGAQRGVSIGKRWLGSKIKEWNKQDNGKRKTKLI